MLHTFYIPTMYVANMSGLCSGTDTFLKFNPLIAGLYVANVSGSFSTFPKFNPQYWPVLGGYFWLNLLKSQASKTRKHSLAMGFRLSVCLSTCLYVCLSLNFQQKH